jgi:Do/DeqQ family serine protease
MNAMTEPLSDVNQPAAFCRKICLLMVILMAWVATPVFAAPVPRENAVVRAVRKVGPAVVNISSQQEVRARSNPFSRFGMDPFFDSFFRDFFDPGLQRHYPRTSLGSGVIISGDRGLILTNAHVISKGATITVVLQDKREFEAKIVGADPDSDLAVLRIEPDHHLPSIEMGDSDDLMIGETIIAIGNPFGFSHTVTTGVISALHRSIRSEERVLHDFIQTDASINPGNSGGPLLNINGELIGINTAIYAKAQGIGFAIPINTARRIISDLIRHGEVVLPWIGLLLQQLDPRMAAYLNLPGEKGLLVRAVQENSPAQAAGLQEGDILLTVGQHELLSRADYTAAIRSYKRGDRVPISFQRKDSRRTVTVTAGDFPADRAPNLAYRLLGIRVKNLTDVQRRHYGIRAKNGVVISRIDPDSYLARIGAEPGDLIRQIDELSVSDVADFSRAVVKYRLKSSVVIRLERGGQGYYITVRL